MKKFIFHIIFVIALALIQFSSLKAENKFDPKLKMNNKKDYSKEIFKRDYDRATKWHKKTTGALFGASLDFIAGYNSTDPNATTRSSNASVETNPKGGVNLAVLLNLTVFGLNLTTGLDFLNKKYEVESLLFNVDTLGSVIDSVKSYANQYVNIPLNLTFNTMVSESVGLSFSGGPYFGILLNPENAANGFKDFDLGLNGIVTGNYYLNSLISILLGGKYQYGGLNNLLSSASIEKVNTSMWGVFTGLRVGF